MSVHLDTALRLAAHAVPVLPLSRGKAPVANCENCHDNQCGGRPNMRVPGRCQCLRPCHGWAAATFRRDVLTSPAWASAWRRAAAVAYHPGGAGVTVVDLDNRDAVDWACATLPATRTVPTTRGEHWLYRGTMPSANAVRPGVDVKSAMSYAIWRGTGTGAMTDLPAAVLALAVREETTIPRPPTVPLRATWTRTVHHGCRHNAKFVRAGLDRGIAGILARRDTGAGTATYAAATFLARQHADCPGPCGAEQLAAELIAAAVSVGVPEQYAVRQAARGGLIQNGATA